MNKELDMHFKRMIEKHVSEHKLIVFQKIAKYPKVEYLNSG